MKATGLIPSCQVPHLDKVLKAWFITYFQMGNYTDPNRLPFQVSEPDLIEVNKDGDGIFISSHHGEFNEELFHRFFAQCIKNGWIHAPITVRYISDDTGVALRITADRQLVGFTTANADDLTDAEFLQLQSITTTYPSMPAP